MPAGIGGGDIETRFTTIFGQQGMEVYEQFIQILRTTKTEIDDLTAKSLASSVADQRLVTELKEKLRYYGQIESLLKTVTRETLDQVGAKQRLIAANKDLATAVKDGAETIKREQAQLAAESDAESRRYAQYWQSKKRQIQEEKQLTKERAGLVREGVQQVIAEISREDEEQARDAERYAQYWQRKKELIGEEKRSRQELAAVVAEATGQVIAAANQEVQAERDVEQGRREAAELQEHLARMQEKSSRAAAESAAEWATAGKTVVGSMDQEREASRRVAEELDRELAAITPLSVAKKESEAANARLAQSLMGVIAAERNAKNVAADSTSTLADNQAAAHAVAQAQAELAAASKDATVASTKLSAEEAKVAAEARAEAEAHEKLAAAKKRASRATGDAQQQSMALGRAMFFTAQAVEDVNYGYGAILNNIPLIVQAWGQMAGMAYATSLQVAAGASIIGTGILVLQPALREFGQSVKEAFDPKLFNPAQAKIGDIEEELKRLSDKKFKLSVDYQEIDALEAKMERLKRAKAAVEGVDASLTIEQEEAGKRFKTAIVEFAGQGDERTGRQNIVSSLRESMTGGDREALLARTSQYEKIQDARKRMADTEATIRNPSSARAGIVAREVLPIIQAEIASLEREASQEIDQLIDARIGSGLRGNETDLAYIRKQFQGNRGTFGKFGVGEGFGIALRGTTREAVREDKDVQEALAKRTPEGREEFERQKKEKEEVTREINRNEQERIRRRREEVRKRLAEEKAAEENFTPEGNEATKSGKALAAANKKALREHNQEVAEHARETLAAINKDKGLSDSLDNAIAGRLGGGATADQVQAALQGQMDRRISLTVPADLRGEVAAKALQDRIDAMSKRGAAEGGFGGIQQDFATAAQLRALHEQGQGGRLAHEQQENAMEAMIQQATGGINPAMADQAAHKILAMQQAQAGVAQHGVQFMQMLAQAYAQNLQMTQNHAAAIQSLIRDMSRQRGNGNRVRPAAPLGRKR